MLLQNLLSTRVELAKMTDENNAVLDQYLNRKSPHAALLNKTSWILEDAARLKDEAALTIKRTRKLVMKAKADLLERSRYLEKLRSSKAT